MIFSPPEDYLLQRNFLEKWPMSRLFERLQLEKHSVSFCELTRGIPSSPLPHLVISGGTEQSPTPSNSCSTGPGGLRADGDPP